MNGKSVFKKIRRYCVKGNAYVFLGVGIAAVIAFVSLLIDGVPLLSVPSLIVVIVTVVLGGGLYIVGLCSTGSVFRQCVSRFEKMGVLDSVMTDLDNGESVWNNKFVFGKRCFAPKGYGMIFLIDETDRIELSDPALREDGVSFVYIVQGENRYSVGECSKEKLPRVQNVIDAFNMRKHVL